MEGVVMLVVFLILALGVVYYLLTENF